ncbi:LCR [Medicago truncatula]|uniref:LCR n=1 Tax=Medicago truncatula TaxID=3880 RepID=A0A072VKA7_MEDTR|nr:LCR [Medicago truncatula]
MATGIDRVLFFIAILCVASILTPGGATNEDKLIPGPTPKLAHCFRGVSCPVGCIQKCAGLGLGQPGHCQGNQCCCAAI